MGRNHYSRLWLALWVVPMGLQVALLRGLTGRGTFESPATLFWLVSIAAALCLVPASLLLLRAARTGTVELSFVGLFYLAVSLLPFVHGLTTPGVLIGENTTTMASALWSIPVGVVLASPTLLPMRWQRRLIPRYWQHWTIGGIVVLTVFCFLLLANTDLLTAHEPGTPFAVVLAMLAIVGCVALSTRGLLLARVAGHKGPLAPALGYSLVAASAAVWFGSSVFSIGFWAAHALDIGGVLVGTIGALAMLRRTESIHELLKPALVSDPLAALEVGLEPIVHHYIADLAAKDQVTRDHVVRTCELAVRVAEELGFAGSSLRHIGLVGLLHDVGKLEIPDAILNKPDKLTDDEFTTIKHHPIAGERMMMQSPVLRYLGPGVRSHHERIDGRGYPDGLAGTDIPTEARIVSACDAYDAMANTRHYRNGMSREKAVAVLREHAGAQWDAEVVDAVIRVVERHEVVVEHSPIDTAGAGQHAQAHRVGCGCVPDLVDV